MIDRAEKEGKLKKGSTVIEPTSGNTGIGLAAIGAARGYRVILTMPDTMSKERINLMKAYGAEVILTAGDFGMKGAIEKADELAKSISGAIVAGQFVNFANPEIHKLTTGEEIWNDTDGKIDYFVSCVGTGGTVTGVGEYLKAKNENIKIVAVEPKLSPVLSKGYASAHKIQGIGAGFVPKILNTEILDEIITVDDDDAFITGKEIGITEGFLAGISSGAALWAAKQIALREKNKNIVVIFPDTGDRYLSTPLFN